MRRHYLNIWSALIVATLFFTMASCERKDLLEPHTHGHVNVDITNDFGTITCQSVTLVFKSLSDGSSLVKTIKGTKGQVDVPYGDYDVLIYTSDFNELDGDIYRGMDDFATAEAYTRQWTDGQQNLYMNDPDPTYSYVLKGFQVRTDGGSIVQELTQRSYRYWFVIQVDGLQLVHTATFNISGMYTSAYLQEGTHREDESATQTIQTVFDNANNRITGEFWAFGPQQDSKIKNTITLVFVDGKTTVVTLDDHSDYIKTLTHGGEIKITQKIVIKGDETGGFSPSVTDWDDTSVDIPM